MTLKVGDMVCILKVREYMSAYRCGLRMGDIGTIIESCPGDNTTCLLSNEDQPRWHVNFPSCSNIACCPQSFLRRIEPPEACESDFDWKNISLPEDLTILD